MDQADLVGLLRGGVDAKGGNWADLGAGEGAFTMALADYVYVLDFGAVIAEGVPAAVRNDPEVKAAYLGQDADEE